ncbi:phenylalanine--tRNA ligase subunit beta [Streptococcus halichoeri]|uniref:phenylalanine--tRNA ligase subunit beta n=1 Tax=Streptococcus halichoeri TaxID=254785 RepID=UPI00135A1FE9|nr:phenylalanine--tRNA ligase subunit beta [Streptococcus halichoeri]
MLVSYNWLKELVAIDVSAPALAEKMSTTGIEVEGITVPSAGLSKLVVGHVLTCEDVPDTHLHRCLIDTGEDEPRQIVCGAPNIAAGLKVIVALPGARIADNYKIKKGKIRGMESLGMVCSLQELGLPESIIPKAFVDGIQILPDNAIPGESVFAYLGLDDEIIELSITPNRADALSMRGVAYEVAAIYDKALTFTDKTPHEVSAAAAKKLSVRIETDQVAMYAARVVEDVTVAPSPQWLQNRLMNAGIRPVNNVVDVTNYVLLTFGQPMHAFDYAKFSGSHLAARQARTGETLVTLDGEERELLAGDLLITIEDQPVALAGVMGGQATEIDDSSTTVVLEAAVFNSQAIRKTSGRLNLRSESSSRFEKGINHDTVLTALDYAAALLEELAGGQVLSGVVQAGSVDRTPVPVLSTLDYVNVRLGTALSYADLMAIFDRLGFAIHGDAKAFTVEVPRRRWDITIQADLVEEIARLYGYDKLPTTLPQTAGTSGELTAMQTLRRKVRRLAEGAGLNEIISYALTTQEKAVSFTLAPSQLTELMWPMSVERSTLRQSLIPGILDTLAYNQARKNSNLAVYEIGKIFKQEQDPQVDLPQEIEHFAFAVTGLVSEKDFQTPATPVDFFYAKGILEMLFERLGISAVFERETNLAHMHPGRTARILVADQLVGIIGQVHPQVASQYGITETYVAELDLALIQSLMVEEFVFEDITKYPAVSRDIALLVPQDTSHQMILEAINLAGVKRLKAVKLFDVYLGPTIATGFKSMAYSLTFQNPTDNLTDEEVAKYMEKITKSLVEEVQAEIR